MHFMPFLQIPMDTGVSMDVPMKGGKNRERRKQGFTFTAIIYLHSLFWVNPFFVASGRKGITISGRS